MSVFEPSEQDYKYSDLFGMKHRPNNVHNQLKRYFHINSTIGQTTDNCE